MVQFDKFLLSCDGDTICVDVGYLKLNKIIWHFTFESSLGVLKGSNDYKWSTEFVMLFLTM